jgi:hypothetical protein
MKTSIRVIAAVAICLAAQSSFSQTIFGAPDCGQWLAEKSTYRKAWLSGYLSGLNSAHYITYDRDPLDLLSSMDQAFAWMDNYCRKNPLEKVSIGGFILFVELVKKDKARK